MVNEMNHIWTADMKSSEAMIFAQLWMQFLQLRREAWKIQDFNWVWTRDLAILVRRSNQQSYEATEVGSLSFVGSDVPVGNESMMKWFKEMNHIRTSYMIHFIYHFIIVSFFTGPIRTHKWPAPNFSGFIAQLVRAPHPNRQITGSNPVEVLKFSGFSTQL